jgi:hypothetical protein
MDVFFSKFDLLLLGAINNTHKTLSAFFSRVRGFQTTGFGLLFVQHSSVNKINSFSMRHKQLERKEMLFG